MPAVKNAKGKYLSKVDNNDSRTKTKELYCSELSAETPEKCQLVPGECLDNQIRLTVCDVFRDLVPFVQFKKREKHLWRSVIFSKVAG